MVIDIVDGVWYDELMPNRHRPMTLALDREERDFLLSVLSHFQELIELEDSLLVSDLDDPRESALAAELLCERLERV